MDIREQEPWGIQAHSATIILPQQAGLDSMKMAIHFSAIPTWIRSVQDTRQAQIKLIQNFNKV